MMDRIALNDNCKKILKTIKAGTYDVSIPREDTEDVNVLIQCGLVTATELMNGAYINANLSDKGRAYLHVNPMLKNPSIWEDKKYWITTAGSVIAIIISIIALCK